jgi:hypothetical protein
MATGREPFPIETLNKATYVNLVRYATYLHLETSGMRRAQIARLIYWRITRSPDRRR